MSFSRTGTFGRNRFSRPGTQTHLIVDLTEEDVGTVYKTEMLEKQDWRNSYSITARNNPAPSLRSAPSKSSTRRDKESPRVVDLTSSAYPSRVVDSDGQFYQIEEDDFVNIGAKTKCATFRDVENTECPQVSSKVSFIDLVESNPSDGFSNARKDSDPNQVGEYHSQNVAAVTFEPSILDPLKNDRTVREPSFLNDLALYADSDIDVFQHGNPSANQSLEDLFVSSNDTEDDFSRKNLGMNSSPNNKTTFDPKAPVANMLASTKSTSQRKTPSESVFRSEEVNGSPKNSFSGAIQMSLKDKWQEKPHMTEGGHSNRREAKKLAMEAEKRRFATKEREELAALTRQKYTQDKPQDLPTKKPEEIRPKRGFAALEVSDHSHSSDAETDEPEYSKRKLNPFHCPICDATYARRDGVKRHFPRCVEQNGNPRWLSWDSHESCQNKKYERFEATCFICKKPFDRLSSFQEHCKRCTKGNKGSHIANSISAQSGTSVYESGDKKHSCPFCNVTCTRRHSLKKHLVNIHNMRQDPPKMEESNGIKSASAATAPIDDYADIASLKRPKSQPEFLTIGQSVLQPNRKRKLEDIGIGTLFAPKQIASTKEFGKYTETMQQRIQEREKKLQILTSENNTLKAQEDMNIMETPWSRQRQHSLVPTVQVAELTRQMEIESGNSSPTNDLSEAQALSSSHTTIDEEEQSDSAVIAKSRPFPAAQAQRDEEPLADVSRTEMVPATRLTTGDKETRGVPIRDIPKEAKFTSLPIRPTTGGKGISAATKAVWEAQEQEVRAELEVVEKIYVYYVVIRNWILSLDTEEEHALNSLGPYYTLAEANEVAKTEIKHPLEEVKDVVTSQSLDVSKMKRGCSYTYNENEHGMQTHILSTGAFRTEATVKRGKILFLFHTSPSPTSY